MSDPVWSRDEPDSPCQRVCVIHPDQGLCIGCLRTRDEIANWSRMSAEQRREVIATLPERKLRSNSSRKGRRRANLR